LKSDALSMVPSSIFPAATRQLHTTRNISSAVGSLSVICFAFYGGNKLDETCGRLECREFVNAHGQIAAFTQAAAIASE
jgi:hypothetical protein